MFDDIKTQVGKTGIVPVAVVNDADKAISLANAIIAGGIDVVEITFRTVNAAEAIAKICKCCPQMTVGAGTVLTIEQAKAAKDAGARFIVSPGFSAKLAAWSRENGILYIPGVATATEVQCALEEGLTLLKFFPAEALGGLKMVKALSGPFKTVRFMATGGIGAKNVAEYAADKNIYAVGGSWIVDSKLVDADNWTEITSRCSEAVGIIKEARGK